MPSRNDTSILAVEYPARNIIVQLALAHLERCLFGLLRSHSGIFVVLILLIQLVYRTAMTLGAVP